MASQALARAANASWRTGSAANERYDHEDALHVSRSQAGDGEAFVALVRKYEKNVYGIIYRMCGPGDDVADFAQDVFVRALTGIPKFQYQGEASFRTWLYRITVNVCINELRRRRRRRHVEGPSIDQAICTETDEVERLIPDTTTMPHALRERRETRRVVQELLTGMAPMQKAVLTIVDIQGLPYEEASRILGCKVGTVKSRLFRARQEFGQRYRQELEPRYGDARSLGPACPQRM